MSDTVAAVQPTPAAAKINKPPQRACVMLGDLTAQGHVVRKWPVTTADHAARRAAITAEHPQSVVKALASATFLPDYDIVVATAPDGQIQWYSCVPVPADDLVRGRVWTLMAATWANAPFVATWWAALSAEARQAVTADTLVGATTIPIGFVLPELLANKARRRHSAVKRKADDDTVAATEQAAAEPAADAVASAPTTPRAKRPKRKPSEDDAVAAAGSSAAVDQAPERLCETALLIYADTPDRTLLEFAERNAANIMRENRDLSRQAIMKRLPQGRMNSDAIKAMVRTEQGVRDLDMLAAGIVVATERCQTRVDALTKTYAGYNRQLADQVAELTRQMDVLRAENTALEARLATPATATAPAMNGVKTAVVSSSSSSLAAKKASAAAAAAAAVATPPPAATALPDGYDFD